MHGTVTIPVPDLTEAGHFAAIETLTGAIDRNLGAMVRDYFFMPTFRTPNGMMDEADFFASVQRNAPGGVPELRALIQTFSWRAKDYTPQSIVSQLYCNETDGALCHAMHALARLDDDCGPVLLAYLGQTDLSHENYLAQTILPEFIERTNWEGAGMLELGVNLIRRSYLPGRSYLWRDDAQRGDWNLRATAHSQFTARQFAEKFIEWVSDGPAPKGQRFPSGVYGSIENFIWAQAEADNEYDMAVVETFLELTGWEFLQELGCRLIQRGDMPQRGNIWRNKKDRGDWNLREGAEARFEPDLFAKFFVATINKGSFPKPTDVLPELDENIWRFIENDLEADNEFDEQVASALVKLRPRLLGS